MSMLDADFWHFSLTSLVPLGLSPVGVADPLGQGRRRALRCPPPPHPPWLRPLRDPPGEGCRGAARARPLSRARAPAFSLQSSSAGAPRGGGVGCGGRARAAPARSRRGSGGGSSRDGGGGWSPVAESHIRVLAVTQLRPPRRCDPSVRQIWRR